MFYKSEEFGLKCKVSVEIFFNYILWIIWFNVLMNICIENISCFNWGIINIDFG